MTEKLKWSVVIPAFNEEKNIEACIDSLKNQSVPENDYEIIIVDNESTDATAEIARSKGAKVILSKASTVGGVRNDGALHSNSTMLAFTDADCIIPRTWLESASKKISQFPLIGAWGGPCKIPDGATWVQKSWVLDGKEEVRMNRPLAGSSLIISRELFEKMGKFNEKINAGEDTDLSDRLIRAGHKTANIPELSVIHLGYPSSLLEVSRQQFWHSSSYLKTPSSKRDRVLLLTLIFTTGILSSPLYFINSKTIIVSIILTIIPPLAFTIKRFGSSKESIFKLKFFNVMLVNFFYFIGRSAGLAYSLTGKYRKTW
jgi:glycosyltransferase involved in cell wall biosynthesis